MEAQRRLFRTAPKVRRGTLSTSTTKAATSLLQPLRPDGADKGTSLGNKVSEEGFVLRLLRF